MANDIYSNPLNDTSNNDTENNNSKSSFLAAKEAIKKSFSNNSEVSSASNKSTSSNNSKSSNSRNSDNNSNNTNNIPNNNGSDKKDNKDNKDDSNEIYSRLKSTPIHSEHGPTEYVYSMVHKDGKSDNKNNDNKNNNKNNNSNGDDTTNGNNDKISESDDDGNEVYAHIPENKNNNNSNDNSNDNSNNDNNNDNNESNKNNKNKNNDLYDHIAESEGNNKVEDKTKQRKTDDFYSVFLGSMLVELNRLKENKVSYVSECIQSVAGLTSATTTLSKTCQKDASNNSKKITLSENRGMSVVMRLEGGFLRVLERGSNKTRLLISLDQIRMWGVGKEKNSRELAIISKDEEIQNVLCRVFLCEKEASSIAKSFYEVCQKLALKRKNDKETKPSNNKSINSNSSGTTSSNESKSGSRLSLFKSQKSSFKNKEKNKEKNGKGNEIGNEKEALSNRKSITQQTLPLTQTKTVKIDPNVQTIRTTFSDGYRSSLYNHSNNEIDCFYLGMMEVHKTNGLKTLEHAIDMVKRYVAEENWLEGGLRCSQSGVFFENNSSTKLSCASVDITYAGTSFKYKNFLGVMVTRNRQTFVHVFSIKGDSLSWFETMKFVCHLHSSKYPKPESTLKKWK